MVLKEDIVFRAPGTCSARVNDIGRMTPGICDSSSVMDGYPLAGLHLACFLSHTPLHREAEAPHADGPLPVHAADAGSTLFPTLPCPRAAGDLTILVCGGMLPFVEPPAAMMEKEGLEVEIAVPAQLAALAARPRPRIAEEAVMPSGAGAEVADFLAEAGPAGRSGFVIRCGKTFAPALQPEDMTVDGHGSLAAMAEFVQRRRR